MPRPFPLNAASFLAALCLVLVASGSVAAPDGPSCDAIAKASGDARAAKDTDRLEALLSEAKAGRAQCGEQTLLCLGRGVALGYLSKAYTRADAGASPEELDGLLAKGRSFGAPWPLLVFAGDLKLHRAQAAHDGALFAEASAAYQQAVAELQDEPACSAFGEPPPPSVADIETIYRKMSATLLLSAPLRIERTRCAPCNWAFFSRIGAFAPRSRPLPLTFEEGHAELTPEGRAAAVELAECLKAERPPRIALSGHADQDGSDAYNLSLSSRRLAVVREFLVKSGFAGEILLQPRGKSQPFSLPDASGYSPDEIGRLNRRIELLSDFEARAGC